MRSCPLRGERILVTGGAGTIGSHLVDQLVHAGAEEIIVLDNFGPRAPGEPRERDA
jgi:UDP-glucose 4-epimerase